MSDNILMPKALTAENGAKYLFSGEFKEEIELDCECCGDGENCEICGGSGHYVHKVTISWTTIKEIYSMAVQHFGHNPEPLNCIGVDLSDGYAKPGIIIVSSDDEGQRKVAFEALKEHFDPITLTQAEINQPVQIEKPDKPHHAKENRKPWER